MSFRIFRMSLDVADVWIATDDEAMVDYSYGGSRMINPLVEDFTVEEELRRLMLYESGFKNQLINLALKHSSLERYQERLPQGFLGSRVGGARCLIRPKSIEIYLILQDMAHPEFLQTISPVFERIGAFLNEQKGKIKLTPDFGRFAGLADILAQFTPHVLGIRREDGGCGGKSSFSSTGIIAALEPFKFHHRKEVSVTLIGSAGALGSDIFSYLRREEFSNVAVCDLAYDDNTNKVDTFMVLPSRAKTFTDVCLTRGDLIIATTVGEELENSNWQVIPSGSVLFLAHNLAIPEGEEGIVLMKQIADRGILALPGQVLTLGGALTSRLEWFWRQSRPNELFDKPLAHALVRSVVSFLLTETLTTAQEAHLSPYEAMLLYLRFNP